MSNPRSAKGWAAKIKAACEDAGTYQPYFDTSIQALAELLERREAVARQYKAEGSVPVIEQTNKAGFKSRVKNPLLVLWLDLQSSALSYYKELGLTPGGRTKLGLPPDPSSASGPMDPLFGD